MEIVLEITRQQLVDNLQTLSDPDLRGVIVDSLDSERVSDLTIISVVSEILERLLKNYTDELEHYTQRHMDLMFSENPHHSVIKYYNEQKSDCESYVTATQTAIESVRAISAGPGDN
jgi:hypothetical protein